MGHLTPTFWDFILKSNDGARGFADRTSPMLIDWLTTSKWQITGKILAVDFFHTTNLIEQLIKLV